jgi:hypothetical protein
MRTPTKQISPQKASPRKLKPHDRLQQQIDNGRVGDEAYVTPTRAVDIDTRLPAERVALNLWADEYCRNGRQSYFERARLIA